MTTRQQMLCLWCGPVFLALFLIGFWPIAGFVPPSPPTMSAVDIARFYQHHVNAIRLGQALVIASAGLMMPWVALIAAQMRRISNCSIALVYTELGAGAAGILLFIEPSLIWSAAAYRPDRDPQLTQLLHDVGWIMFILPFTLASVQGLAIGAAIVLDEDANPIFPRWSGYLNLWVALLFVPGVIASFFKIGPFAWNGVFPFWIPLLVFATWFGVMFALLRKAIRRQDTDAAAALTLG